MIRISKKSLITVVTTILLSQLIYVSFSHSQESEITGSDLFGIKRCERCHTIGRGKFVGPDLLNVQEKYPEEEIITWITDTRTIYEKMNKMPVNPGFPPMPPQDVSKNQAKKIARYIISFNVKTDDSDSGKIAGKVFNFSKENKIVSGVNIILRSLLGDRETDRKETTSDRSGQFSFGDLKWNRSYEISVSYKDAWYTTEQMVFSPGESLIELELPVYEPTKSEEDISIQQHHIVVEVMDKFINVAEVLDIKNTGKNIFVGKRNEKLNLEKQTMAIELADNAENINLVQGLDRNNLILKDNTIYDTSAIPPGYKRITITYEIPFTGTSVEITKNPALQTVNMLLLVNKKELDVDVSGLNKGEDIEFGNQSYSRWQGSDISQGSRISLKLDKPFLGKLLNVKLIPLVLFILILTAGVVYNFIYRKKETY